MYLKNYTLYNILIVSNRLSKLTETYDIRKMHCFTRSFLFNTHYIIFR